MQDDRPQSGFMLVEVIVSIALTAIVILGLAVGLLTSVNSSNAADRRQALDSAVGSASESIRSMAYPVFSGTCPTAGDYAAAFSDYVLNGNGWSETGTTVDITGVEHWDPGVGAYSSVCPPADPMTHRLAIEVDNGSGTATAEVVVSAS